MHAKVSEEPVLHAWYSKTMNSIRGHIIWENSLGEKIKCTNVSSRNDPPYTGGIISDTFYMGKVIRRCPDNNIMPKIEYIERPWKMIENGEDTESESVSQIKIRQ
jgi:hypothetical protein